MLSKIRDDDRKFKGYRFVCPGCKVSHVAHLPRDVPIFQLVKRKGGVVCESIVNTLGKISFSANCTHHLAGKTVDV